MNCYNHPEQPAVAQCPDCGKGLCAECAAAYPIPICNACNRKRINVEKDRIVKELLLTFGLGVVLTVLFLRLADDGHTYSVWLNATLFVMSFYVFSGTVSGWRTLTRIAPNRFLLLPISGVFFFIGWMVGWMIFLLIKLALSVCVGLIALPIRTVKNISRLRILSKIKA